MWARAPKALAALCGDANERVKVTTTRTAQSCAQHCGKIRSLARRPSRPLRISTAMKNVVALDFDGVICNSSIESSLSAWRGACEAWPTVFDGATEADKDRTVQYLRDVRPVIETGFENLLLIRLLFEEGEPARNKILSNPRIWEVDLKDKYLDKYGYSKAELVERFGSSRDQWIKQDVDSWLSTNEFYPGIADALRDMECEYFIVTTKQGRFASALLRSHAGLDITEDSENLFALGSGPKQDTLSAIEDQYKGQDVEFHFVEDRMATLRKCIADERLTNWNLHLVTWGYNLPAEKEEAANTDRISLMTSHHDFRKILCP